MNTKTFPQAGIRHRLWVCFYGFNVAVLIQLFSKLFEKFLSRWWATLVSILAVFAYTNRMVELLAAMPGGVLVLGEFSLGSVALMFLAVLAPVIANRLPGMFKNVITPTLVLTTLGLVAVLAWRGVWTAPDGRLRLVVFDLNGSQVLLIRGPRDLQQATAVEWLSLSPQAIIATGAENAQLADGGNVLDTHPQGWYLVTTDGRRMWIEKK